MTSGYGAANPRANILGPTNRGKQEGPEDAVEFGADSYQPTARPDRKSRRTTAANPVATYAKGGAVKRARGGHVKHRDTGGSATDQRGDTGGVDAQQQRIDRALGRSSTPSRSMMNKYDASKMIPGNKHGGKVKHRDAGGGLGSDIEAANVQQQLANPSKRAAGGRTKHKGKGSTHVNIVVAPSGGAPGAPGAMPMMPPRPPMAPPAMPPHPPMAGLGMPPGAPGGVPPAAMAPHPGLPPGAGIGPGTMPPGMPPGVPPAALAAMMQPRANGGAVGRAKGGEVHADAKQDKALIEKTLHDEGLIHSESPSKRARGGNVETMKRLPQQKHEMTAGAVTGIGRLEKIGEKPKDAGPKQAV